MINWNSPESIPQVKIGTEELFWIARLSVTTKKQSVYLAYYQNRPFHENEEDEVILEEVLADEDGDYISSVGWVSIKQHYEFENYYEPIYFGKEYKLLGWAEYAPPEFTDIGEPLI